MRRRRWVAFGCSAFAALAATRARAQTPAASLTTSTPPTYTLSWVRAEGAEDCPTGRALAVEVERRLGRAVFDAAAERSFEVEVTRFGNTYHSDVYVRDVAGNTIGHRSLQSDEAGCSALLNATALAIALVIDPEAAAREPAARPAVADFAPAAEATPPRASPPAPPAPVPPPSPVAPTIEMRLPAPPPRTPVTMSLRAQLTAGVVAATSPGFELAFGARPGRRWGLALSGSYALSQTRTLGIGSLDVGITRASALATFDVGQSQNARLVLSGGPTLGALHLAVRRPSPVTEPGDFLFIAAELDADLQVAVTDTLFLELGGALLAPLRRQQFLVRRQSEPVWSQPPISGLGFVGAGARFP